MSATDLRPGSVGTSEITDGAITGVDLGIGSVASSEIATDGGEIVDNSLTSTDLATNSAGNAEIASGAVSSSKLAASSVDSSKVAGNSLTTSDIKGADVNGATISLSAGAVANGRCEHFNVGVGGAASGEAVVFSLLATPPEGMIFYGVRVSAANTVVLAICNLSGAASPAITDLPVRVITFG